MASRREPGKRRDTVAKATLVESYREVLTGSAHAETVLADLADVCMFYEVLPPGSDAMALADHNARRAVFQRIFSFLNLTDEERGRLAEAVRLEQLTNTKEGIL